MYSGIIQGLFYGLACSKPFIVPVPVRDGVTSAATLDDLEVNYWVKQRGIGACTTSRRDLRRAFDRMPQSHDDLDANYIFYFDRPMGSMQHNQLVRRLARLNGCTTFVRGSVLVVKKAETGFVNMTVDDILRTNFLFVRCVRSLNHAEFELNELLVCSITKHCSKWIGI